MVTVLFAFLQANSAGVQAFVWHGGMAARLACFPRKCSH